LWPELNLKFPLSKSQFDFFYFLFFFSGGSKSLLSQVGIGPLLQNWKTAGKDFRLVHKTLRDISRLQAIFSEEIGVILGRLRNEMVDHEKSILTKAWRRLFDLIEYSVDEQRVMGQYITDEMLTSITRILKEDEGSFKNISQSYREVTLQYEKAKKNVKKAKENCKKEDDRAKKYTKPEDVQAKRDEKPSNILGWGKKIVHGIRHAKETNEDVVKNAYERARQSEEEYKQAVSDANQAQYNFVQKTDELKNLVHATLKRRAKKRGEFHERHC